MGRSSRALLAVVLGSLALVAAAPGAPPASAQDAPSDGIPRSYMRGIEVGDHWTYRISGDQSGEIHNEVVSEMLKRTAHFETQHPTFEIHAAGHVVSDELAPLADTRYELSGRKWVRVTDHATVQVEGQSTVRNIDNSDAREAFDAPMVDLVHPFATGYEWVATARWWVEPEERGAGDQGISRMVQQRVKVEGMETVTVPAGTFDAWRLNYTSFRPGGGFSLRWHVDEVCDFVREDSYDKDRHLKHRLELVDHSCSATEVEQPVYDIGNVTLVSRGVLGGPTGNEPPRPGATGGADETRESGDTATGWLWPALGVTLAAGALLVVIGRRRS